LLKQVYLTETGNIKVGKINQMKMIDYRIQWNMIESYNHNTASMS
jgi:hypothetical protein